MFLSTMPETRRITPAAIALVAIASALLSAQEPARERISQEPFDPFRVIGTIHYVGSTNAGAFLISTPEGHILLDTGYPKTEAWVRKSIEQLGFRLADIKLILNTHAHSDHVGGHAQFKEWTGAKILTSQADAPVLADGGRSDFRGDGRELWKPVTADGIVGHGQQVTLGGVTLVAHMTPGHTKGNTTWTTTVDEGGRKHNVVFVGSMGLNRAPLLNNAKYLRWPTITAKRSKSSRSCLATCFLRFTPTISALWRRSATSMRGFRRILSSTAKGSERIWRRTRRCSAPSWRRNARPASPFRLSKSRPSRVSA